MKNNNKKKKQRKMKEGNDGFVRADQIDLKSIDEQLERHLSKVLMKQKEVPLRRSIRERRSEIPNDYIIFLSEYENGVGLTEEDPINT